MTQTFRERAEAVLTKIGALDIDAVLILEDALLQVVKEENEACAKEAESGYLYGTDGKNDDYACSTCGGDIRAMCCIWAFNHNGNKEIATAIRKRVG